MLVHELRRRGGRYGLATMCIGVGQGIATVVERIEGARPALGRGFRRPRCERTAWETASARGTSGVEAATLAVTCSGAPSVAELFLALADHPAHELAGRVGGRLG